MLIKPAYDLKKIRFATDEATYRRAVDLYENGKVTKVEVLAGVYRATVLGTTPYSVTQQKGSDPKYCNNFLRHNWDCNGMTYTSRLSTLLS